MGELENLTLTGSAYRGEGNTLDNVIIGNGVDNWLLGGLGNDRLDGGAGADILEGGTGDDSYVVDSSSEMVVEGLNGGIDTIIAPINFSLQAYQYVENVTLTGTAQNAGGNALNNVLTGNALDNALAGLGGNDRLDGGAGNDLLVGQLGDDTFVVESQGDVVYEYANEGTDTIEASIDYALTDAADQVVENLTLTGTAANGTGNGLDNVITGNASANQLDGGAGADWLDGKAGADTMIGGSGSDVFIVDDVGDVTHEETGEGNDQVEAWIDWTLAANIEVLQLANGAGAINGTGNSLSNVIWGNAANNVIDGGGLADTMLGAGGDDTYIVDHAGDTVIEYTNSGTDTIVASVDYTLSNAGGRVVENLTLTGPALYGTGNNLDNVITGNGLDNQLSGGVGNDTLDGGAGADYMAGGTGDDTYYVDYLVNQQGDTVVENAGEGTDTVIASVSMSLGYSGNPNIENLILVGSATAGYGSVANNVITANDLGNTLNGNLGNDTLIGGDGHDSLVGDMGSDMLTGGEGSDLFEFWDTGSSGIDSITDFVSGVDMLRLDPNAFFGDFQGSLQSQQFAYGTEATTADHRIIYDQNTGNLWFDADGVGGTAAILFANLGAETALNYSDFWQNQF